MTTTITFADSLALVVFHTEAEGIAEVKADDGDLAMEAALMRLIDVTGIEHAIYPLTVELPDDLVELAQDVLANCLDSSSGLSPDDEGADDYVFEGQVEIRQ